MVKKKKKKNWKSTGICGPLDLIEAQDSRTIPKNIPGAVFHWNSNLVLPLSLFFFLFYLL